jgi:prepilin-type processing-associated H-X9-DG protein
MPHVTTCSSRKSTTAAATARTKGAGTCPSTAAPFDGSANRLINPSSWTFYDPLASYHVKSSTFGFADGHAEKHKWRDQRTLDFINVNAADPSSHSGIRSTSPDNEDLRWLIEHFMEQDKM